MRGSITIPVPRADEVRRFAAKAALAIFVLYLVYIVREIWLPLGLALILAMVLDPVVDRMELRGWSRKWATAFIFGSFLIIVCGLVVLSLPYLSGQAGAMQREFAKYFPDPSHAGLLKSLHKMNVPNWLAQGGASAYETFQGGVDKSTNSLATYGVAFAGNLIWVVIVPIISFYLLRDFNLILTKSLLIIPSRNRPMVQEAVAEITSIFGKYLRGLGLVSVLNGAATGILLFTLGVPSAILLGIIAGILYSVPYVGAIVTVALTAAVAFVGGGAHLALVAVGASVVLHQIVFDQIITPRILGGHVGLHPILSIVALLAGNLLLGIIGMILAVPVAACIQIAVVAVLPKLALEVELPTPVPTPHQPAEDGEEELNKPDEAVEDMKAAVAVEVERLDEQASSQGLDGGSATMPDPDGAGEKAT